MKKWKLLPHMAVKGIVSNGNLYYPYLIAGIFAAFTWFVFSSILYNDLIKLLPRSGYAWMMLSIGKALLGIILLFFLIYANSFLIKQRKREMGLYNLLGLEKKHIGMILFLESLIMYAIVMLGGILLGAVLSKFFFLCLLKLCHLPANLKFVFRQEPFKETLRIFAALFLFNFMIQLLEVRKARPVELLSGSKKGEKEPRLLALWAAAGLCALLFGYCTAIQARVNSGIFTDFFLAVFFVIVGTNLLFTSGSVFFLKLLRDRKAVYYRPSNFITISGMYYRMKKNAAGLSNICIFSTMVIITLACTVSLYADMDGVAFFLDPYDLTADFAEGSIEEKAIEDELSMLEQKYGIKAVRADVYDAVKFSCYKEGERFEKKEKDSPKEDIFSLTILLLDDYNQMAGEKETLLGGEILVYSDGVDFGFDTLEFMGIPCQVKKEISNLYPYPRTDKENFDMEYIMVVKDRAERDIYMRTWAEQNDVEDIEAFLKSGSRKVCVLLDGEEAARYPFAEELRTWCMQEPKYVSGKDGLSKREETRTMNGGLLFIGIVFGAIFFLCLIMIMYYKQISEGHEDARSFAVMCKVGMSNGEIRSAIHKQILLLFGLPLFSALMHTAAGMFMVDKLMAAIGFYNTKLMILSTAGVSAAFFLLYGISYLITARTYYSIVKN